MKKTAAAMTVVIIALLFGLICHGADARIVNQNGETGSVSLGDLLTVQTDIDGEGRYVQWYADGEKTGEASESLRVGTDMLGKSITATMTSGEVSVTTEPVTVKAGAPTLEFSGNAGDYSAYLTWSGNGNGAEITGYEISYSLSSSPSVVIGTVSLGPGATGYTLTGLSGGAEHTIRLTAYNSVGSTSVSIRLTPNDPDLATVVAVKNEIESSNFALHMDIANDASSICEYLTSYFRRFSDYGVTVKDVIVDSVIPAVRKSSQFPDAPAGRFSYIVEITKGDVSLTTKKLTAQIDNSSSIVYLFAEKFSVQRGEKLTVTAAVIDVADDGFKWYISQTEKGEGTLVSGADSASCSIPTDKAGEYYVYCVCGGVSSSRMKIVVTEPFVAVSDVELSTETLTVSESSVLHADVYPSNATNSSIVWVVVNDGGCMVSLNGRTITAYVPGTVTLKASVKGGTADGDYEKTFYLTVKEKAAEGAVTEKDNKDDLPQIVYSELDCSGISGVDSLTVKVENGTVQITPVTKESILKIIADAGIDADEDDVIGAVKFVYSPGAIAHETMLGIKGYDNERVRVLTVNGNGGKTLNEQTPDNGSIYGSAVSPDTVILLKQAGKDNGAKILPVLAALLVPAAVAVAPVVIASKSGKKRIGK
ncbi:MAG: fibronectin type III domain-containing protein [Clostridia bacterium]|nr:fibronectin type III domain-containing protein [Clostridia bacterium]